jgi:hypothetical protein
MYTNGSPVVYRKTKFSVHPGPRAQNVSPAKHGDSYGYYVDKPWRFLKYKSPDKIIVKTRRGKQLELDANDPNLRPASLWDRFRFRGRFPAVDDQ